MDKNTIGSFIAWLRKSRGMTQVELAKLLQVSNKTVSKWENNETMPDILLIPKIAKVFNITCDELLNGEVKESKNDAEQDESLFCDNHTASSTNNARDSELLNKCKLLILVSVIGSLISTLLLLFCTQATLIIGLIFSIAPLFSLGFYIILHTKLRQELIEQSCGSDGNSDSQIVNYKIYNIIFVLSLSALAPFIMLIAQLNTGVFLLVQLVIAIFILYFVRIIISHFLIKNDIIKPLSALNYKKLNRIFIIIWAVLILSFIVVCALGNMSYFTTSIVEVEYECDSEAEAVEIEEVLTRLLTEEGIDYRAVHVIEDNDYYRLTLYSTIQDDISYEFSISGYEILQDLYKGNLEYQLDGAIFYYDKVVNINPNFETIYLPILAVFFLSLPIYAIVRKVGEIKVK